MALQATISRLFARNCGPAGRKPVAMTAHSARFAGFSAGLPGGHSAGFSAHALPGAPVGSGAVSGRRFGAAAPPGKPSAEAAPHFRKSKLGALRRVARSALAGLPSGALIFMQQQHTVTRLLASKFADRGRASRQKCAPGRGRKSARRRQARLARQKAEKVAGIISTEEPAFRPVSLPPQRRPAAGRSDVRAAAAAGAAPGAAAASPACAAAASSPGPAAERTAGAAGGGGSRSVACPAQAAPAAAVGAGSRPASAGAPGASTKAGAAAGAGRGDVPAAGTGLTTAKTAAAGGGGGGGGGGSAGGSFRGGCASAAAAAAGAAAPSAAVSGSSAEMFRNYEALLQLILGKRGVVERDSRRFLEEYQTRCGITRAQHAEALRRLGWSREDYAAGRRAPPGAAGAARRFPFVRTLVLSVQRRWDALLDLMHASGTALVTAGSCASLASITMPSMVALRVLQILAGTLYFAYNLTRRPALKSAAYWNVVFMLINGFMLHLALQGGGGPPAPGPQASRKAGVAERAEGAEAAGAAHPSSRVREWDGADGADPRAEGCGASARRSPPAPAAVPPVQPEALAQEAAERPATDTHSKIPSGKTGPSRGKKAVPFCSEKAVPLCNAKAAPLAPLSRWEQHAASKHVKADGAAAADAPAAGAAAAGAAAAGENG